MERSILKLPFSKPCAVPFALQKIEHLLIGNFRGGGKGEKALREGEDDQERGQQGEKDGCAKTGQSCRTSQAEESKPAAAQKVKNESPA